ncbi:MAG TPA: hypothetical protein VGA13_08850 [Acidimicrobiales bacterium]
MDHDEVHIEVPCDPALAGLVTSAALIAARPVGPDRSTEAELANLIDVGWTRLTSDDAGSTVQIRLGLGDPLHVEARRSDGRGPAFLIRVAAESTRLYDQI